MAGKGTLTALKNVCRENSILLEGNYAQLNTSVTHFWVPMRWSNS